MTTPRREYRIISSDSHTVEPPDLCLNGHVTRHQSGPVNMAAAKMALRVLESCGAVAVG